MSRVVTFGIVVVLAGCGGGQKPTTPSALVATPAPAPAPTPDPTAELHQAVIAWGEQLCACPDEACSRRVGDDFRAWAETHDAELSSPEFDDDRAELGATFARCAKQHSPAQEAIAAFVAASDAMCRCSDKSCADDVNADLERAMEKYKDVQGTDDEARSLEPIMKRYMECSMRAMGATP